ncbi:acyltransferase family protein [Neobacillus sp. NPDC093182]|uniref:acyltransferase family protein n=1 Tax=Neobacillus sp. NPDC093182 TaxID=3364297 RepID=UPI0037FA608F
MKHQIISKKPKDKQRNKHIDLIKGIAIILVVIGHNIQYGSGYIFYSEELYFNNRLFQFIYSFHMPLFMLVSGYLFFGTVERYTFKELITSRILKIFIPIIVCTLIVNVIQEICYLILGENIQIVNFVKHLISSIIYNLWFLWAIFFSSMLVIVVNKFFKDNVIVYCIILSILLLFPDIYNAHLYKYMYPYFVGGYLYKKYRIDEQISHLSFRAKSIGFTSLALVFIILLPFFNYESYIYTSKISLLGKDIMNQLGINIYRWLIGFIGSTFIICLVVMFDKVFNLLNVVIIKLGQNSLGIYIISTLFINTQILLPLTENYELGILLMIVETIFILVVCYFATEVIKYFRLTNRLMLGGR